MITDSTAEKFDDVEWIDPISGLAVRGDTLSAEIHNQVPGVVGEKISFHPLIEEYRLDGTPVHAFFMHDSDGQPLVGMREIPTRPDAD
ncbi:MAG: hypothetical protein AAB896_00030 [Patescibacteria group bacterium]